MKKWILVSLTLSLIFVVFSARGGLAFSQGGVEVNYFYSRGCPHCLAEEKFLDKIEKKYPEVIINRYQVYPTEDPKNVELLKNLCAEHEIEQYCGLVPLTFVGKKFFLGFDDPEGIGEKIEKTIQAELQKIEINAPKEVQKLSLPILGKIDVEAYSLPTLAVILGFLDGFNVCSLGALVLILGLVLALKSKRRVLILGGIFLLTTAVIYGILIFLWYQLFALLGFYLRGMQIIVGILALAAGGYLLWQFFKLKKRGPVCEIKESAVSEKLTTKLRRTFEKSTNVLALTGGVFLFTVLITIVEFPCSAVVPVIFAGILSQALLSPALYLLYISLYVIFYLLDEIVIFLAAVFTMKLWIASPKFVTWMSLIGAILLFFFGFYYLFGF